MESMMPKFEIPEVLSEGKRRLLALEKEGKYLFHGSLYEIEVLEPKQQTNSNKETGEREDDGEPAVCATAHVDVAIFRALINANVKGVFGPRGSEFSNEGEFFAATKNLLDKANEITGRIYVLDKNLLEYNPNRGEYRSNKSVVPIEVIEVTAKDLPKNIEAYNKERQRKT